MEGLERIGFLHSDDFYLRKFQSLRQNSTVYIYRRYFEMLRSLVIGKYSELNKAYFVSQCINGLNDDIKKVVQLFRPSTLEHVFSLATIQESIIANKAKTIANTATSLVVSSDSSLSIKSTDKNTNDQVSASGADTLVIANSSHYLNGCPNDSNVWNSQIQTKSCEDQLHFKGIVVTVDAEKPISGTVQNVKIVSLVGFPKQYPGPLITSDTINMGKQFQGLMVSSVQQIWPSQTHYVKVDQIIQENANACHINSVGSSYGCPCQRGNGYPTFVWEPGPWLARIVQFADFDETVAGMSVTETEEESVEESEFSADIDMDSMHKALHWRIQNRFTRHGIEVLCEGYCGYAVKHTMPLEAGIKYVLSSPGKFNTTLFEKFISQHSLTRGSSRKPPSVTVLARTVGVVTENHDSAVGNVFLISGSYEKIPHPMLLISSLPVGNLFVARCGKLGDQQFSVSHVSLVEQQYNVLMCLWRTNPLGFIDYLHFLWLRFIREQNEFESVLCSAHIVTTHRVPITSFMCSDVEFSGLRRVATISAPSLDVADIMFKNDLYGSYSNMISACTVLLAGRLRHVQTTPPMLSIPTHDVSVILSTGAELAALYVVETFVGDLVVVVCHIGDPIAIPWRRAMVVRAYLGCKLLIWAVFECGMEYYRLFVFAVYMVLDEHILSLGTDLVDAIQGDSPYNTYVNAPFYRVFVIYSNSQRLKGMQFSAAKSLIHYKFFVLPRGPQYTFHMVASNGVATMNGFSGSLKWNTKSGLYLFQLDSYQPQVIATRLYLGVSNLRYTRTAIRSIKCFDPGGIFALCISQNDLVGWRNVAASPVWVTRQVCLTKSTCYFHTIEVHEGRNFLLEFVTCFSLSSCKVIDYTVLFPNYMFHTIMMFSARSMGRIYRVCESLLCLTTKIKLRGMVCLVSGILYIAMSDFLEVLLLLWSTSWWCSIVGEDYHSPLCHVQFAGKEILGTFQWRRNRYGYVGYAIRMLHGGTLIFFVWRIAWTMNPCGQAMVLRHSLNITMSMISSSLLVVRIPSPMSCFPLAQGVVKCLLPMVWPHFVDLQVGGLPGNSVMVSSMVLLTDCFYGLDLTGLLVAHVL